ncbi:hypothetical protein Ahy_A02g007045 [Arachis hypogaea]|uniref:Ubiquitin-like protease family profile domain-containing protein n=1 Tax=Arachis hypogaea TaxID=3818 RepID=A0A445EBJ4_ARAHY|nr:hypothetical protein Ahy_A02g007045 [Arachis hypogaea]
MRFGGLAHVSEMNVSNTLLIELLDRFDVERGCLKTLHGTIYITPWKVATALVITNRGNLFPEKVDYKKLNPVDKEIFDSIKNISLATLARNVLDMSVEGEKNWKKFKRTFCFLLPTTVSVASPIHKPSIFHVDNIREWDWAKHELKTRERGKKQSIDGYVFVLILIYFHETKFPHPFAPDAPPAPWVAHWTREMIVEWISSETTQPLTQGSSTPSVNAASNTRLPLALSLPSSVQEELMKDCFSYVPPQEETQQTSNNDSPQEAGKNGVIVSLTSSVIEDLLKDDYVYEVSNKDPAKEQQQQAQEPPVQQESEQEVAVNVPLEQPCEEPTEQQSKQEAPVDVCPPEPNKQGVTVSITSFVIEEFFKDADVYQVSDEEQSQKPQMARQSEKETLILSSFDSAAQPREKEDERPSFSLEIKVVVDAGVAASLKFVEGTSSESTLTAAQAKDGTNEYELIFVLKHEGLYEGLREYFISLMPGEQVHAVVVSIHILILNEIKTKRYQEQIYIVLMDIVIFVPIGNGVHWWLWIADVNKKKFYDLDPINKNPEEIPDS